jgi:DNA mismatch repair protein MSH6
VRKTAEFDCLLSLAKSSAAIGSPSCRPKLVDSDAAFIEFEELRHPGIAAKKENFIANDVKMGQDVARIILLTGPNMAGKSTLMRQTCVAVIMAQLGMYVPAESAAYVLPLQDHHMS